MDVNEFAQLILTQTRERLAAAYSQEQADRETVQVRPGPKYTKVDIGPEHNISGKYMIENATGIIYGIKGYGQVHKGHTYGTLDTADQWYWGGYTGEQRPQPQPETEAARERRVDAGLEQHRQEAHGGGLCDCARKAEGRDIKRQPVDPELFRRTAPQWNCVDFPGEGLHYLTPGGCAWCSMTREQIAAERAQRSGQGHSCPHCGCSTDKPVQVPGGPGPYTHIVKRASGYVAGYFRGEPPADFVPECNANVPDDPAHVEVLDDEWPESFTDEMRSGPTTGPCWNGFCIATDCNGVDHVDFTGRTWTQKRGNVYCPACHNYSHPADDCPRGYDNPVFTDYERGDPATRPVTGAPLPDVAGRRAEVAEMRDRELQRRREGS